MRNGVNKRGCKKTLKIMTGMMQNRNINDIKETVKITKNLSLEVNAIRNDIRSPLYDGYGEVLSFEVYAIKNNISVDCVTIDAFTSENFENDIMYLLNCYV